MIVRLVHAENVDDRAAELLRDATPMAAPWSWPDGRGTIHGGTADS